MKETGGGGGPKKPRRPKPGPKNLPSNLWTETFRRNRVDPALRAYQQGAGAPTPYMSGAGPTRAEMFGDNRGDSGGGSGGRDYQKFLADLAAMRQQAEQRLVGERDRQLGDINQLQGNAMGTIDRDAIGTARMMRNVYDDNARQGSMYQRQIAGLGRDIAAGLSAYANPIAADLAAQGIRITPNGITRADAEYARALAGAQGTMNARMSEVNAGARADSLGGVLQTRQSGRGTAANEGMAARNDVNNQYMQQLLELQRMGLGV